MSSVRSAKSRHRNSYDTFAGIVKLVKGFDTDKQGQCGVKSSTYAYHDGLAVGMNQAFGKSGNLDIEDFLA